MSAGQQSSSQQAASWTEPPWSGWIETTGDALLILEAAKRGIIPRVTRRLVDSERKMIMSGSVFVFEEEESGIRRWTDGFYWSPSRILGNFLLYRETDKRSAAHRGGRADIDMSDVNEATRVEGHSLSRPRADSSAMGVDRHRERNLVGSLTNTYKFKPDGLMKKVCCMLFPPCTPDSPIYILHRPFLLPSTVLLSILYHITRLKMLRVVVYAHHRLYQSFRHLISVQNISIKLTSEIHPKSR